MSILRRIYILLVDFVETFVIAGAIFVVFYAFIFRFNQVSGQSMYPNFEDKELIITNLVNYRVSAIKRGDVVVFISPDPDKDYIKRVIGLPSERMLLREGKVYINGKLLDESAYLPSNYRTYGQSKIKEGQEILIPKDSYVVLGDNREFSFDSRDWGFVTKDKFIGKSSIVYWPIEHFRLVKDVEYKN